MTVWLAMYYKYEGHDILGVFDTSVKAEQCCAENCPDEHLRKYYDIEEHDVE